jgi:hypothetical protein
LVSIRFLGYRHKRIFSPLALDGNGINERLVSNF